MATAAHRARRGAAAGGREGKGVRAFHAVSSSAGPDQADGHESRPSVTIRQRGLLAAVVGAVVGPTTPCRQRCAVVAQPRLRSLRWRCAIGLRNRSRVVRSRVACSGCAVWPGEPDVLLRRVGCADAQAAPARVWWCPSAYSGTALAGVRQAGASASVGGCRRTTRSAPTGPGRPHGRVCGRADHDPDHGLRVPIVTVVGVSWLVVGSGPAGFLKVINHTF